MHQYKYRESWAQLLTPEIVRLLTQIHEAKGKQNVLLMRAENRLDVLRNEARVQSIDYSNRIEEIRIHEERFKHLVDDKAIPKGDNELILAGYREALQHVCENHEYQPMASSSILRMYQILHKYFSGIGDRYRSSECGQAIEQLCSAYQETLYEGADPLLVIPMVLLDFQQIQPFESGNGQMSRLLLLLLLYQAGYSVGKFVSVERLIEHSRQDYENTMAASLMQWEENANDPKPFTIYLLGIIEKAYGMFFPKAERWMNPKYSKKDRILDVIRQADTELNKHELINLCPDASEITIKRVLRELVDDGKIRMEGNARATTYRYIGERE